MAIQKIAVLGSGVMGSGIAALMANAGVPVLLLDIVPKGVENRNALAEGALEKQLNAKPSGFTHKNKAKLVTCGNLEDDLDKLKDVDWIIEAVLEKIEVKQDVYRKLETLRKDGSIVSSNTSTIPLHVLVEGLPERFQRDFLITHFFNPPRFMHLLELVRGPNTDAKTADALERFADVRLGKGVVHCKDTPGFIANRIGVYWLMAGLLDAVRLGVDVETADAVMGRPLGFPKTGIFGLFDLIGIDLMPLIAHSMLKSLPEADAFRALYEEPDFIKKMIAGGYTGRKGKGGFYRINREGGGKTKEVLDFASHDYRKAGKSKLESASAKNAAQLLSAKDAGGAYARAVLARTLRYAASLVPEIADDVVSVDNAMKWGFNWKMGPFELIDAIGAEKVVQLLQSEKLPVPELLENIGGGTFYRIVENKRRYRTLAGDIALVPQADGVWSLADVKRGAKAVLKNGSAALWDLGDGIACLEFTSKMNSIDPDILTLTLESVEKVKKDFKGLVIGGDGDNFSVGANLAFILYAANMAAWPLISNVIKQGQQTTMALKYAPFPVVAAVSGMALGGGCEFVLHADAVQAHVESYPGLVEAGVGVIPGWGGCKEMLLRHLEGLPQGGAMPAIGKVFETIATAKVAGSAEEARDMKILHNGCRVTMNRSRLLPDAKALCLSLAENYTPPEPKAVSLPGPTAKTALLMVLEQYRASGKATPHDVTVGTALAEVLSGGDTDITETVSEQQLLDLEHAAFMRLIRTRPTLDRVEFMLANNKPLRN